MRIYCTNESTKLSRSVSMIVRPGKNKESDPSEWYTPKGLPIDFQVVFRFGEAMVMNSVGKYLISRGLAQKMPFILKPEVSDDHPIRITSR